MQTHHSEYWPPFQNFRNRTTCALQKAFEIQSPPTKTSGNSHCIKSLKNRNQSCKKRLNSVFFAPHNFPVSYPQHPAKVCPLTHPTRFSSPDYPSKTRRKRPPSSQGTTMSLSIVHSRAQIGVDAPAVTVEVHLANGCLLYTSPSPRDGLLSRMPSSA